MEKASDGNCFNAICAGHLGTQRLSERAANVRRHLTTLKHQYKRVGYDVRRMDFKPDGNIGDGGAGLEVRWNLYENADEIILDISSSSELTCRLRLNNDDVWRGKWERFEQMPIEVSLYLEDDTADVKGPKGVIGVTIGVGDRYIKYATRAAASIQKYLRIPTAILSRLPSNVHPAFFKLQLFDFFDGTIFFFDADTLAIKPWDISPYINRPEIVCVRDIPNNPGIDRECAECQIDRARYFNTGMMILNKRHHEKVLQEALSYGPRASFFEQTPINLACKRLGTPLLFIESIYNMICYCQQGAPFETVIAHAAGGDDKGDFDKLFPL